MAKNQRSIADYIGSLPDEVDVLFTEMVHTVRRLAPACEEAVKYDMPAFLLDGAPLLYLAAWKKHIGIYPVHRGDEAFENAVGPYRDKQDTVRFMLNQPIPFDILELIVVTRLAAIGSSQPQDGPTR